MSEYTRRVERINVVRMFSEGIDTAVSAQMTIPQGEYDENGMYPCVTVLMHGLMDDAYRAYVFNTDEYGYCGIMLEAPEEYRRDDLYGDMEVGIDPSASPDFVGMISVDGLEGFMEVCRRYMK